MSLGDREILTRIFTAGVERADPFRMMTAHLRRDGDTLTIGPSNDPGGTDLWRADLSGFDRIHVIGTGKATAAMAQAVEEILGQELDAGVITVKYGNAAALKRVRVIEAGHPVPDERSVRGAREIMELAVRSGPRDLVIALISGGGSALMAAPLTLPDPTFAITLQDKQETTRALLACGAAIQEINCVRKHLSAVKGGRLAASIAPAAAVAFILSDVVGDDLGTIASGPTVGDVTTFLDLKRIIRKYCIDKDLTGHVRAMIGAGAAGRIPETPKPGAPVFDRVRNILIGTNRTSLMAAKAKAESLGLNAVVISSQVTGEAREVARVFCGIGKDVRRFETLAPRPCCIIAGGETTVTIRGGGRGGRNQELALAFLAEMAADPEGTRDMCLLSASTDGNDGPTDAAGAFADGKMRELAASRSIEIDPYLKRNDAYAFFDAIGGLLKTGPTQTNVCDLHLMLIR